MKKKIIWITAMIFAAMLLVVVIFIIRVGGAEISEGKYYVSGCENYPDAYIEVTENKIKFNNINLNDIYQKAQMETYNAMVESGVEFNLTEEQFSHISDLNEMFAAEGYEMDYEGAGEDNKSGTFKYVYFCYGEGNIFGLVLEYDSFHKTIQVNSPVLKLIFKK